MYQLEFTASHSYGSEREGISVPVLLKSGTNSVRLAASIDTGATFCLFRSEVAEALGLDLANGALKRFRTAAGSFEAFGHDELNRFAVNGCETGTMAGGGSRPLGGGREASSRLESGYSQ